jgi:hypothetical protein
LTLHVMTVLTRLGSVSLSLPITHQPAAVWTTHAVRNLHDPRLMYCRLRATGQTLPARAA